MKRISSALLILFFATPALSVCVGNSLGRCAGDNNGNDSVAIAELIQGVNAALRGCAAAPCQTGNFNPIELDCGNGQIEVGEQCDFGNLAGQDCISQGFAGGELACAPGCTFDTNRCSSIRYIDNGDGTVSDLTTGLMWMQHSVECPEAPDPLCDRRFVHEVYQWSSEDDEDAANADGSAFTAMLGTLNNCVSRNGSSMSGGLGGYCDWRLPTVRELQTILLEPAPCLIFPCIDPIFGAIASSLYWSSTTGTDPGEVWAVDFGDGQVPLIDKQEMLKVRAVRSTTPCGNGRADVGEECDGADLDGATCVDLGFADGELACEPGCSFDTAACEGCAADCNGDFAVDVAEIVRARAIFLGSQPLSACPQADPDGDGDVRANEMIRALGGALRSCAVAERVPEPDPAAVAIDVEPGRAVPGGGATVPITLRTNGAAVDAVQLVLALDASRPYGIVSCASGTGIPNQVELYPSGCAASGRCTKAAIIAVDLTAESGLFPDGAVVTSCLISVDAGAPLGSYPVSILSPLASDADGNLLPTTGTSNQIDVVIPTPVP